MMPRKQPSQKKPRKQSLRKSECKQEKSGLLPLSSSFDAHGWRVPRSPQSCITVTTQGLVEFGTHYGLQAQRIMEPHSPLLPLLSAANPRTSKRIIVGRKLLLYRCKSWICWSLPELTKSPSKQWKGWIAQTSQVLQMPLIQCTLIYVPTLRLSIDARFQSPRPMKACYAPKSNNFPNFVFFTMPTKVIGQHLHLVSLRKMDRLFCFGLPLSQPVSCFLTTLSCSIKFRKCFIALKVSATALNFWLFRSTKKANTSALSSSCGENIVTCICQWVLPVLQIFTKKRCHSSSRTTKNNPSHSLFCWNVQPLQDHDSLLHSPSHFLTNLTKKGVKFQWTIHTGKASMNWNKPSHATLSSLILISWDPWNYHRCFEIPISAVITQQENPLAFYPRKLTDAQTCYTITKLDSGHCWNSSRVLQYSVGSTRQIYTDHDKMLLHPGIERIFKLIEQHFI